MTLEQTILINNSRDYGNEEFEYENYYNIEKHEFIGSGSGNEVWRGFRITPYDYEEVAIKVSNRDKYSL